MNNSLAVQSATCTVQSVIWQSARHELIMLRTQVFIQEQNVSAEDEWDSADETATHFLVRSIDGAAIGCARLILEKHQTAETLPTQIVFHIGRVAVLQEHRQQGIGRQLMQTVIANCLQHHRSASVYLCAQTQHIRFYQKLGFVIRSNVFMDAGIPHIEMWYTPKT